MVTISFAVPDKTFAAVTQQQYNWQNVKIGGGGGFVPGIIFRSGGKKTLSMPARIWAVLTAGMPPATAGYR